LGPRHPWLWALAIGIWIPVHGIATANNYASFLALAFAFGGAYIGMAVRKTIPAG
jgi:hypothetical protein